MAGLADFLMAAGGAAVSAVPPPAAFSYDPNLTPEANALAGAKAPVQAAPVMQQPAPALQQPATFQRPKGLRGAVGTVFDILAAMGGQETGTDLARQEFADQQAEELAVQKQNVLGAYLADPNNPDLRAQAFKIAPLETFEVVTKLTPKPQSVSPSAELQLVDRMIAAGYSEKEALQEILNQRRGAPRVVGGQADQFVLGPDGQPQPLGIGVNRAPPAPQQPRTQVVTVGDRQVLVDLNTGNPIRDLGGAPPRGTGAAATPATNQLAVLDTGLARLNNAISELDRGNVSGPVTGLLPDAALNFTNPRAVAVAEDVASVSQQELRAILGGQFAAKEGEALIKRQYNPGQSEAENLRRLKLLRTQIETRRKQLAGGGAAAPAAAPAGGGFKVVGKRKPQ